MSATWYCWLCASDHLGICPVGPDDPRRLRESLDTQMGRVAALRGYSGQLRAAILDARDNTQPGSTAHFILQYAANIPAPENE